jgi:uncharacterized membrane protein YdbT with pleckstrin-like domain
MTTREMRARKVARRRRVQQMQVAAGLVDTPAKGLKVAGKAGSSDRAAGRLGSRKPDVKK